MIPFTQIPSDNRIPATLIEVDNSRARSSVRSKSAVFVAFMLSTGSATANTPYLVRSVESARTLFGIGSQLADMYAEFRAHNPNADVWCIGIPDPSDNEVQATAALTISGTATKDGAINAYVAGYAIRLDVATGQTASTVATAIAAKINVGKYPFTASASSGVVTITWRGYGAYANQARTAVNALAFMGAEYTCPGLTASFGATTFGSGAGDYEVATALAAIANIGADVIALGVNDSTSAASLATHLTTKWGATVKLYGHGIMAKDDTAANLETWGDGTNVPYYSKVGYYANPLTFWQVTAQLAGAILNRIESDANAGLRTIELIGFAAAPSNRFTFTERQGLYQQGVSPIAYSNVGVFVERLITNYQQTASGQPDTSYLSAETMFTLAEIARRIDALFAGKENHKLVNSGTPLNKSVKYVTVDTIRADFAQMYQRAMRDGLLENADVALDATVIERNADDPERIDVDFRPDIANHLTTTAVKLSFTLQYNVG